MMASESEVVTAISVLKRRSWATAREILFNERVLMLVAVLVITWLVQVARSWALMVQTCAWLLSYTHSAGIEVQVAAARIRSQAKTHVSDLELHMQSLSEQVALVE
jgi:hypothetical protein